MPLSPDSRAWVEQTLANMTLAEQIGQMLVADFAAVFTHRSHENFQRLERLIREQHIGALVLAGGGLFEIAHLTNELQHLAKVPLLVNADIETGVIFSHPWRRVRGRDPNLSAYLPGGGTALPCFMAMAATRNEEYAYEAGRITGLEARAIGIHWTNSPSVDVNNNPRNPIINTRSFGEDPQLVSRLGAAYVRGVQSAGVIATLKHFPGHGDTAHDTHMQLPKVALDEMRLRSFELVPFRAGIVAGAKAIMTAHVLYPELDSRYPATLSPKILTDLLRTELGFDGLICTDALTMQGITDHYGGAEAAVLAAKAGADLLLVPSDVPATHRCLMQATQSGALSVECVRESARRILTAKAELGLHHKPTVETEKIFDTINTPEAQRLAEKIAAEAITLLEHEGKILPLGHERPRHVLLAVVSNAGARSDGEHLCEALMSAGKRVELLRLSEISDLETLENLTTKFYRAEIAMLAIYLTVGAWKGELRLPPQVHQFLQMARDWQKPALAISFGDPYLFEHLPPLAASICAYNGGRLMEGAVVRALLGETPFRGKLPVMIPGRFGFGEGLIT